MASALVAGTGDLHAAPPSAQAKIITWTGGGGVGNQQWDKKVNWDNVSAGLVSGDTIQFGPSGENGPNNNFAADSMSINGIIFLTNATAKTVSGARIILNSGVINNSTLLQTLNLPLLLGSAQTFNAASGAMAFGGAIDNGGNLLSLDGANGITISSIISGSGGLSHLNTRTGTTVLSGANTYTGATTVSAGVLNIQNNSALGTTAGGVTVASGAALELQAGLTIGAEALTLSGDGISGGGGLRSLGGTTTWGGTITFSGAGTIASDAGLLTLVGAIDGNGEKTFKALGDITANGTISGTGNLVKTAAGTLLLAQGSTFDGSTILSGGTVGIAADSALGAAPGTATLGSIQFSAGSTLAVSASTTLHANRGIQLNTGGGVLSIASGQTLEYGGVAAGSGNLTFTGGGTVLLTGVSDYTGSTTIVTGTTVKLGNGGTSGSITSTSQVINNGVLWVDRSDSREYDRVISGTGEFRKSGAGTMTFTGANTYTGPTTILGGTLQIGNGGTAGTISSSSGVDIASGATLAFSHSDVRTFGGTNAVGGARLISGAGSLAKSGTGTLVLTGGLTSPGGAIVANTWTGGTVISGGAIRATTSAGALGTGTVTLSGGNLQLANDTGLAFGNATTLTASATLTSDRLTGGAGVTHALGTLSIGAQTLSVAKGGNVTSGTAGLTFGATTISSGSTFSPALDTLLTLGAVGGSGGLNKSGAGELRLGAAGSFSGGVTIQAGVLSLGDAGALNGNAVGFGDSSTGTLRLNGNSVTIAGLTTSIPAGSTVVENASSTAATLTVNPSALGTFAGVVQDGSGGGALSLTKTGAGRLILSGANTYTGATVISGGSLQLGDPLALGSTAGGTTVLSGTTLCLFGNSVTGEALTLNGTGNATEGTAALCNRDGTASAWTGTVNLASDSTIGGIGAITVDGVISGSGGLTKISNNVVTLKGTNTYTGATALSAGTLVVEGSISSSSSVSVAAGSNLSGFGTVGGSVTVANASNAMITVGGDGLQLAGLRSGQDNTLNISGNLAFAGAGTIRIGSLVNYTTTAALAVGGDFTWGGAVAIQLLPQTLGNGVYHLISHGNTLESLTDLSVSGVTLGGRQIGALKNNSGVIDYEITGGFPRWNGTSENNNWNATTTNTIWNLIPTPAETGGTATYFIAADTVLFNDLAANTTVNIAENVSPNVTTFNNSTKNYTLGTDASAQVVGGALIKDGTGVLTINNANGFAHVELNAGTIRIGNNGALGTTGTMDLDGGQLSSSSTDARSLSKALAVRGDVTLGDATRNGALTFTGGVDLNGVTKTLTVASDVTFSGTVTGTGGGISKAGTGTLTLSGTNTYTGDTTLAAGKLVIHSGASLGNTSGMLTFSGSSTLSVVNDVTDSRPHVLNSSVNATVEVASGKTFTNSGVISGSGNLVKTEAGTLKLNGANTYAGTTTVSGGVLEFANGTIGATSGLSVASGAEIGFNLAGNGTVAVPISGAGTLRKQGAGSLIVTNDNAGFSGTVVIDGGVLQLGNGGTTGALPAAGGITNNGTLVHNLADNGVFAGTLSGAGNFIKRGAGTLELSGTNTLTGTSTIEQGSILFSSNANLGSVTSGATIQFDGGTLALKSGSGNVALDNGGATPRNLALLAGGGTLEVPSGATLSVTGTVSGAGSLAKSGAGTLLLTAGNTHTGSTTVAGGTLKITADSALGAVPGAFASGHLALSGSILEVTDNVTIPATRGVMLSGDRTTSVTQLVVPADKTLSIASVVGGEGGITKTGAGTLELLGRNNFDGDIYHGGGTLVINSALSLGDLTEGDGDLYFKESAVLKLASGGLTISEGRRYFVESGKTGEIDTNGGTLQLDAVLGGAGALTKSGNGQLHLTAANAIAGQIQVGAGTLRISHGDALGGTAAGTVVASGATLEMLGGITVGAETLSLAGTGVSNAGALRNVSGNNAFGGLLTLTGDALIVSDAGNFILGNTGIITGSGHNLTFGGAGNATLAGVLGTEAGTVIKNGTGVLNLSGNNTYTGNTSITAGAVTLSHGNGLGTTGGGTTVASGAALNLQGGITVGAETLSLIGSGIGGSGALRNLSGTNTYGGAITLGGASRIQADAGTLTLSGVAGGSHALSLGGSGNLISGSPVATTGALTKDGLGTLTLTGNGHEAASVLVSGGTLVAGTGRSGTLTAATVTIGAGATLKGSGTIVGNVVLQAGATYAPGNSIELQTIAGDLNLATEGGGTFEWEMNYGGFVRGTNYDAVNVSGTLSGPSVSPYSIFKIVLPTGTNFSNSFWSQQRQWADIFTDGTTAKAWTSFFGGSTPNFSFYSGTTALVFDNSNNPPGYFAFSGANTLTWNPVPEPTSALTGLLIAAGLLRRSRQPRPVEVERAGR